MLELSCRTLKAKTTAVAATSATAATRIGLQPCRADRVASAASSAAAYATHTATNARRGAEEGVAGADMGRDAWEDRALSLQSMEKMSAPNGINARLSTAR